jgi:putative endonuclease
VSTNPGHTLGQLGEQLASDHLRRRGFDILARNYRTRWGELDIVAYDGRCLVFCEVKARRLPFSRGGPFDAVHGPKRAQLRKMAGRWLVEQRERPYAAELRFDAIGVTVDAAGHLVALDHLEGAF